MKVCYLGISDPSFSRNRVYINALRTKKVEVIEIFDKSSGFKKYKNLYKKHKELKNDYDILVVAYPGHSIVWFAKLISKKSIVFDALSSMYEAMIVSRNPDKKFSLLALKMWLIDFTGCLFADLILVETNSQIKFYKKHFLVSDKKIAKVYSGVDESVFNIHNISSKKERFTVVFRGRLLPEAGADVMVNTAKILENEDIDFFLAGRGILLDQIKKQIEDINLKNFTLISEDYPFEELAKVMSIGHVSLGQLANHERLRRTIPHKAFESIAIGMPYITAKTEGISELLVDGESAIMFEPGNAEALAKAIKLMYNDSNLREKIGQEGLRAYKEKASQNILGELLIKLFNNLIQKK